MHFWIDKRSSQCGYGTHHRLPGSFSGGGGRSRARVGAAPGRARRKGMVTPVHRFQPVECVPRRPLRAHYRCYGPPVGVHSARRSGDAAVYVDLGAPPTLHALAAQRSVTPDTLLRTAALLQPPALLPPHLKCGVWAAFAIATIFVAGAKFYFDRQVMRGSSGAGGSEAGVVCAVVGALAALGCALSLCRTRPQPLIVSPDRVSSTAHRPPLTPTREPSDDISLGTLLQTVSSERTLPNTSPPSTSDAAPPPPYHIAVLLPGREPSPQRAPDPPPPSYAAIS